MKWQNFLVVTASYIFYGWWDIRFLSLIILTSSFCFVSGLLIERAEGNRKKQKIINTINILLNIGILGTFKYFDFFSTNIETALHSLGFEPDWITLDILLPVGISFYTLQALSYSIDVYQKKISACHDPIAFFAFVSFFPQLVAGPIERATNLLPQFYKRRTFDYNKAIDGCRQMLWGFFKKMILADWAAVFVDAIFDNPDQYSGLAIFGVLFYTVQLYADFSGGMDVVIGIASMFGIELDENFKRPFFSISITDFWHRWHITLGTWMKDYVFYPVTLSKWMGKFGKWGKKVFGKKTGRTLPICLANLIVFFVVGVWHGAAWKYIVYGMYNGIIIAFSGLMAEHYRNWKKKFNITGKENWYHVFMIIRTFILVNISWFFDRADTVGQAFHMMKLSVTKFAPSQLLLIPAGKEGTAFTPYALAILAAGCIILFIVSVLQERGMKIRESLAGLSLPITVAIYFCLLASIGFFGSTAVARGFIYAQF